MKYIFIIIAFFIVLSVPIYALASSDAELIPSNKSNFEKSISYSSSSRLSARLANNDITYDNIYDKHVLVLNRFLQEYNSPLAPYANYLIFVSEYYDLPWTWIVAIAGVESGFCQKIPSESHNCWGWNNGHYKFQNYYDAIDTVAKTLRSKYLDQGLISLDSINRVYAPIAPRWASKVRYFINRIENFEKEDPLHLQFNL